MKRVPVRPIALLFAAAAALWLMIAGSGQLLGFDLGQVGAVALISVAWMSLYQLGHGRSGDLDEAVSPGEWRAWIGLFFMLAAVIYFFAKLPLFGSDNIDARVVVRNLVTLGIAWAVLGQVLASRWQGKVQEDERDREILQRASAWGRGALVFLAIALAVTLGFSPLDRLAWATPFFLANLLIFGLMLGWLVEYAAIAGQYWRDRQ
jgi:hypothetical protein